MDLSHSRLKGVLVPKSSHHWLWLCIWWSPWLGCMSSVISAAVKLARLHPQRGLNIVSASPRTHLLLLCCFKERWALDIEGTNVGTIQEMVVLVNPKGGDMVSVKAQHWGCYRSTGQKKKPERMWISPHITWRLATHPLQDWHLPLEGQVTEQRQKHRFLSRTSQCPVLLCIDHFKLTICKSNEYS